MPVMCALLLLWVAGAAELGDLISFSLSMCPHRAMQAEERALFELEKEYIHKQTTPRTNTHSTALFLLSHQVPKHGVVRQAAPRDERVQVSKGHP